MPYHAAGHFAGIIAAGGTLGILLPPSITMILYAVAAARLARDRSTRHRQARRGEKPFDHAPVVAELALSLLANHTR